MKGKNIHMYTYEPQYFCVNSCCSYAFMYECFTFCMCIDFLFYNGILYKYYVCPLTADVYMLISLLTIDWAYIFVV